MSSIFTPELNWNSVIRREGPVEERIEALMTAASDIEQYLACDTETEEEALQIVRSRLAPPMTPQTYDTVVEALRALMGPNGAGFVHWYLVSEGSLGLPDESDSPLSEDDERLAEAVDEASKRWPGVMWLLRRLHGACGPELRQAIGLWKEDPDDWRNINREVYFDIIRGRYEIRHRIDKVNGDSFTVEGPVGSVIELATSLITTLTMVESTEEFPARALEMFTAETAKLLGKFEEQQDQPQQPEVATAEAAEPDAVMSAHPEQVGG